MLRSLFSVFALTAFALGISATSSAQVTGCTNPIACNYNASATVDNGFCQIPVYYVDSQSTLKYDCDFTEYVTPLDQACALSVINADPFCANNMWDTACEDAYNDCCPSGGSWYIPNTLLNTVDYTPMVFACEAPENYTTIQSEYALAFAVVYNDCFYSNWYIGCAELYNEAIFGCANPGYWIPVTADGNSTVIQGCVYPGGAYTLADADCINEVFADDPFCLTTAWDNVCQASYSQCVAGCPDAVWYLPVPVAPAGTQPVFACDAPANLYFLPEAGCFELLAELGYDLCFSGGWTTDCNIAYDACVSDCGGFNLSFQVPLPGVAPDNVVIPSCDEIDGYAELEYFYVYGAYLEDPSCYFSWDQACWEIAAEQFGCDNIGWHITNADVPEAPQFNCDVENATLVPSACFGEVVANDPFCLDNVWDQYCQDALEECVNGCTYPFACNYSPNAVNEDQTCEFPGCTDPTALNYLAYAGCDDGTCVFDAGQSCTGDLNSDGVVNVTDLTTFLSVFGTSCND